MLDSYFPNYILCNHVFSTCKHVTQARKMLWSSSSCSTRWKEGMHRPQERDSRSSACWDKHIRRGWFIPFQSDIFRLRCWVAQGRKPRWMWTLEIGLKAKQLLSLWKRKESCRSPQTTESWAKKKDFYKSVTVSVLWTIKDRIREAHSAPRTPMCIAFSHASPLCGLPGLMVPLPCALVFLEGNLPFHS